MSFYSRQPYNDYRVIHCQQNAKKGANVSDFLDRMKTAAKAKKKTIVLPEGEDPRTIEAAKKIIAGTARSMGVTIAE